MTDGQDQNATTERLMSGYTGRISLVLSVGWFVVMLGRNILPPLLPAIVEDLAISPAEAGVTLSVMWGFYALVQYPGGRFSDHLSRTTVLAAALGALIVGFVLMINVATFAHLLLAVVFVGSGGGLYFISQRAFLSDLFIDRRAQAFGLQDAVGSLGSAIGAGLAVVAIAVATWQSAFLPLVGMLLFVLVALHRWSREGYALGWVRLGIVDTGTRVFKSSRTRWLLAVYALYAFSWQAIAGFLPIFLQSEKGFSSELASGSFAILFVVAIVMSPTAGNLGDRTSRIIVAAGSLLVGAFGLVGILLLSTWWAVILGVVTIAAGLRAFPPVMQAYLMDLFPEDSMGGDFGAFKGIYTVLGSLGPTYVGVVVERIGFTVAYASVAAGLLVATAITVSVVRLRRQGAPVMHG